MIASMSDEKTCTCCQETKPLTEYNKRLSGPQAGSYLAQCRQCLLQKSRDQRAAKGAKPRRPIFIDGPEPAKSCSGCGEIKPLSEFYTDKRRKKGAFPRCKSCVNEAASNKRKTMRDQALNLLGQFCSCCGENEQRFLTFDHINDDGAQHRKGEGVADIVTWIDKHPKEAKKRLRVLCFNCNCARQFNNGICPHEEVTKLSL